MAEGMQAIIDGLMISRVDISLCTIERDYPGETQEIFKELHEMSEDPDHKPNKSVSKIITKIFDGLFQGDSSYKLDNTVKEIIKAGAIQVGHSKKGMKDLYLRGLVDRNILDFVRRGEEVPDLALSAPAPTIDESDVPAAVPVLQL